jgi:hypothetical protein
MASFAGGKEELGPGCSAARKPQSRHRRAAAPAPAAAQNVATWYIAPPFASWAIVFVSSIVNAPALKGHRLVFLVCYVVTVVPLMKTVGLEVKAGATVAAADFNGLRKLAEAAGQRFTLGLVLYDGDAVVPFGPNLFAVPISSLWS